MGRIRLGRFFVSRRHENEEKKKIELQVRKLGDFNGERFWCETSQFKRGNDGLSMPLTIITWNANTNL